MTNILHIYSTAGISGTLAKYQRRIGHDVKITDNRNCDLAHFYEYVPPEIYYYSSDCVATAAQFKEWADIFHVHSITDYIPRVRLLAGRKPVILHLHGLGDIAKITPKIAADCSMMIAAFPSIWKNPFEYLDNPIDLEIWTRKSHEGNNAFWVKQWDNVNYNAGEAIVKEHASKLGLNLTVINRWKELRPFISMPEWYHAYDKMIEYKHECQYSNNVKGRTLGLGAMEALASGLPVYFIPEERWLTEFPLEHSADVVVRELDKLYQKVLKK